MQKINKRGLILSLFLFVGSGFLVPIGNAQDSLPTNNAAPAPAYFKTDIKKRAEERRIKELENWRKRADAGDIKALSVLCFSYTTNKRLFVQETDPKHGFRWCQKGAEKGDQLSLISLATLYYEGRGVSKNEHKAFEYTYTAAKDGNPFAQYRLGNYYFHGIGTKKDISESFFWHERSAYQGYAYAQSALGLEYLNGWGTPRDYIQSYAWFNIASAQGDKEATKIRDEIESVLSEPDLLKAQELSGVLNKEIKRRQNQQKENK